MMGGPGMNMNMPGMGGMNMPGMGGMGGMPGMGPGMMGGPGLGMNGSATPQSPAPTTAPTQPPSASSPRASASSAYGTTPTAPAALIALSKSLVSGGAGPGAGGGSRGGPPRPDYAVPADAVPPPTVWYLFVYRDNELVKTIEMQSKATYTIGRAADNDIVTEDRSCSYYHAVLQFREREEKTGKVVKPYVYELGSRNGTTIKAGTDTVTAEPRKFVELVDGDKLAFGSCKLTYILLRGSSFPTSK